MDCRPSSIVCTSRLIFPFPGLRIAIILRSRDPRFSGMPHTTGSQLHDCGIEALMALAKVQMGPGWQGPPMNILQAEMQSNA